MAAVHSTKDRAAALRDTKLADMATQVANGRLTVRQMTDEERARFPRKPVSEKAAGKRRRS